MKMTRLRNVIMADFDTIENGKPVPDRSLGREDLEHWMKGKNYLSVTKFQYVDRWIRLHRNDEIFSGILTDLLEFKEAAQRKSLVELYARDSSNSLEEAGRSLPFLEGNIFLSEVLDVPAASEAAHYSRYSALSDFRQIAIYFRTLGQRSASVTVVYIDKPISQLNPRPSTEQWSVCFGYLTLVGQDEIMLMSDAILHTFRGEFPGSANAGTSVSNVSLYFMDEYFSTSWFSQICSQNLTGHHELMLPDDIGTKNISGRCEFKKSSHIGDEISNHIKSLTNRYLIW